MSGTATVPNSFANAVTATGAQLDANYNTLVAYINDPTNRNNYAADGAATNTVVLAFSPPVVGGYTAGLEITWKWGATNSGAVVVNANGLGNVNLVNGDGSALVGGQGVVGSAGKGVYDGTRFIYLTPPSPASSAQVATATASASFLSPANVKFSPFGVQAWATWNGTATGSVTPLGGSGVSHIQKGGTGTYTVFFSRAFSSTAWASLATSSAEESKVNTDKTTTSCVVVTSGSGGSVGNAAIVNILACGVLA
jgi:hypothetical protein